MPSVKPQALLSLLSCFLPAADGGSRSQPSILEGRHSWHWLSPCSQPKPLVQSQHCRSLLGSRNDIFREERIQHRQLSSPSCATPRKWMAIESTDHVDEVIQSIPDGGPGTAHSSVAFFHKPEAHSPRPREKPAEDRIPPRKCLYFVKTDGDPALQTKR